VCRCVLKVPLPSWPHCNDYLTVWHRMSTCHVKFSASGSDQEQPQDGHQHDRERPAAAPGKPSRRVTVSTAKTRRRGKSGEEQQGSKGGTMHTKEQRTKQPTDAHHCPERDGGVDVQDAKNEGGEMPMAGRMPMEGRNDEEDGEGGSSSGESEGCDTMEFVCNADKFSLGSEGWAIDVFKHLL
jgi:hypothetical protein